MTETFRDLLVNLFAAGIAFAVGASLRRISFGFRTRALRSFWKPVVHGGVRVAIGSFFVNDYYKRGPGGYEGLVDLVDLAGYAGLGDLEAYVQIKDQLRRVGVRDFELGPGHQVSNEQRKENLILIGGPHSNPLTAKVMDQIPHTYSFGLADGSGTFGKDTRIYDSKLDTSTDCRVGATGMLESDQGIIIRCANPFAPDKSVIIMAGSWGFGTAAATRLIESRDFLKHTVINSSDPFEAVFSCEIEDGEIRDILLGAVRRLAVPRER